MNRKSPSSSQLSDAWSTGIRCWIEREGKVVLGAGRANLLEQIEHTHSIRAAARALGMSYRRAWLLVQSVNHGAGEPLVVTSTGGKEGGGAVTLLRKWTENWWRTFGN